MRLRRTFASVFLVVAAGWAGAGAEATTVEGTLSYDGRAPAATFSGLGFGRAAAHNWTTDTWSYGTVDPALGTYSISGLGPGSYSIEVLLSANDPQGRIKPRSGELYGSSYVDVGGEPTITKDLAAHYAYRVTQPLDSLSTWVGGVGTCPYGALMGDTFTFAWGPVPAALRYEVAVRRASCTTLLSTDLIDPDNLSTQVEQGTVSGEEYVLVELRAYGTGGLLLTVNPTIGYSDGSAEAAMFHSGGGGGGGRLPHPSSSVFVPQVARLPGVPPSYWTSDLVLTNPTATDVHATLVFTPRDGNGSVDYQVATVTVPATSCRVVPDLLGSLFATEGAGSLEVSPAILEVDSRIATPAAGGGSYGQGLPAIGLDDVVSLSDASHVLGVGGVARGAGRSNLVLVEVWGESAQVTVVLADRDGVELGRKSVDLLPYENTQINDVVGQLGGPAVLSEGQLSVEVTGGGGRVGAVLSVVDNGSQDPTTLRCSRR